MFICQVGMHINVQGHRNANLCEQTYDAFCTYMYSHSQQSQMMLHCMIVKSVGLQQFQFQLVGQECTRHPAPERQDLSCMHQAHDHELGSLKLSLLILNKHKALEKDEEL